MNKPVAENKIALCYIRIFTSSQNPVSVQLQQKDITKVCDENGWEARYYIDECKSEHIVMRPAWKILEADLESSNVVAVVANDLSCLHRIPLKLLLFVEKLEERGIKLVLANSPLGEIDTSSLQDEIILKVLSWTDEMYAEAIAENTRRSIQHRKAQGISIGKPPFGTQRDAKGYLVPSTLGFWLMPDGTWQTGTVGENSPDDRAVWRSDYECAKHILELYVSDASLGNTRIAYKLQEEGWAFRNRKHQLRHIESVDVRRVVSNYLEYGGIVTYSKAKDRFGYHQDDITVDIFNPERVVFPVELLVDVAKMRKRKSTKPNRGSNQE